jgi:hypothetical protein
VVTAFGLLVLSALASACGLVAQTIGARRADRRGALDPGLLARLAGDPVYVAGFLAQCAGFVLAFLARGTLPLYVVQAGSTAAVGIAALMGLALGWRLRGRDLVALAGLAAGLALLAGAAQPSVVEHVPGALGLTLLATLAATVVLAVPAARIPGGFGSVVIGALAGVAFAVVAVAARPVAAHPLLELWREPLAYLVVAAAVVGQGLLALALQRGATTPAAASMDTATTLIAAVVGLAVLGDRIAAGRASWVAAGLVLVVGAVLVLASAGSAERAPRPDAVPA